MEKLRMRTVQFLAYFHDPPWKNATQPGLWKRGFGIPCEEFIQILTIITSSKDKPDDGTSGLEKALMNYIEKRRGLKEIIEVIRAEGDNTESQALLKIAQIVQEILHELDNAGYGICENGLSALNISGRLYERLNSMVTSQRSIGHEFQTLFHFLLLIAVLKRVFEEHFRYRESLYPYARVLENLFFASDASVNWLDLFQDIVKKADRYAAGIDRYIMYNLVISTIHGRVEARHFVNMYNPVLKHERVKIGETTQKGSSLKIRHVLMLYVILTLILVPYYVAEALMREAEGQGAERGNSPALPEAESERLVALLHEVYSAVYEPLWLITTGAHSLADTRSPNHTVFDHNSAVATASLAFTSNPDGACKHQDLPACLVKVRLRGIQAWISESRRMRDLWASSWMASWLAWKTVEPVLDEVGSGALLRPTPRLHVYHASRLWSRVCGEDAALRYGSRTRARRHPCFLLRRMLGLYWSWPIDPVAPTEYILLLPQCKCEGIRLELEKNYRNAWSQLVEKTLTFQDEDSISEPCEEDEFCSLAHVYHCYGGRASRLRSTLQYCDDEKSQSLCRMLDRFIDYAGAYKCVRDNISRIEPPLPLEVVVSPLENHEVTKDYIMELESQVRSCVEKQIMCTRVRSVRIKRLTVELVDKLLYHVSFSRLYNPDYSGVTLRGRRSGKEYLRLARTYWEKGVYENCSVCGRFPAVVDGRAVSALYEALQKEDSREPKDARVLQWLAREVGGDRLCPYCYVKRVFRVLARSHAGKLTGLQMPKRVYNLIQTRTVDAFTTRSMMDRHVIVEHVERVAAVLEEMDNRKKSLLRGMVAPSHYLGRRGLSRVMERTGVSMSAARLAADLVLEAVHNTAFPTAVKNKLDRTNRLDDNAKRLVESLRLASNDGRLHRRQYALLYMDGDSLGKLLRGELRMTPEEFVEKSIYMGSRTCSKDLNNNETLPDLMKKLLTGLINTARNNPHLREYFTDETSTLATIAYHSTISRSLAVQAVFDRSIIEALGGLPIYIAGDDMMAVIPPFSPAAPSHVDQEDCSEEPPVLAMGLLAPELARWTYWGAKPPGDPADPCLLRENPRLKRIWRGAGRPGVGFNILPGLVSTVPAPAVYGRSGAVLVADNKYPFWLTMRRLHELEEEAKQAVRLRKTEGENRGEVKDVLVVESMSRGVARLPLSAPPTSGRSTPLPVEDLLPLTLYARGLVYATHADTLRLERLTPSPLSRGTYHDLLAQADLLEKTVALNQQVAFKLARHLLERNARSKAKLQQALELMGAVELLQGELVRLAIRSQAQETVDDSAEGESSLFTEIVKTAHTLLGGL